MGKATNNTPGGINNVEGLPISSLTEYGVASGADDNDNSGSLSYIRLEFGGYPYQQDKEINGFTFGAVGRGTNLDHLQVSYNNDDAFEWFGGTVNAKYLVSYRNLDDDFDTDFGFSGNIQFGLAVRDPQIADAPAVSTSEFFESDNNATGSAATPLTSGIFSNITCIGSLRGVQGSTVSAGHRNRVRIRRNSALKVYNSVFTDQATRGVFIDGSASETNALNGTLIFKNNILAGYGVRATESGTFGIINSNTFVIANANDTLGKLVNASSILTTPYSYTSPDYRPSLASLALSGSSFTDAALAAVTGTSSNLVLSTIPSSMCIGDGSTTTSYVFVASTTVTPGYCSLSWSVSAGLSISSTTVINPTFTVSTIGTFSTFLTVTNADGTQTSTQAIITSTCSNVGISELTSVIGKVVLFPNPTSGLTVMNLISNKETSLNVAIYDITGKLVATPVRDQKLNLGENQINIQTSELNNGIYLVTYNTAYGKETVKLVVQH